MLNINFENTKTLDQIITDFSLDDQTNTTQLEVAEVIQSNDILLLIEYTIKDNSLNDCLKIYNSQLENLNGLQINNIRLFNDEIVALDKLDSLKEFGYYDNDTIHNEYKYMYA